MKLPQLRLWLRRFGAILQVAVQVVVGKVLLTLFPERVKQNLLAKSQKTGMARSPNFSYDNWGPTFFSTQYFWFVLKIYWQRLEDTTEEGGVAPDCPVVCLSGQRSSIGDFMQGNRPLVLNFGSCT